MGAFSVESLLTVHLACLIGEFFLQPPFHSIAEAFVVWMPLQHRCAGTLLLLLLTSSNRRAWDATSSRARPGLPCLLAWQMSLRRAHDGERFQPRGPVPTANRKGHWPKRRARHLNLVSSILCSRNGSDSILGLDRGADCGEPCLVRYWRGCSQLCRRLAVIDVSSFGRPHEFANVDFASGSRTAARTVYPGCDLHNAQTVYPGCSESGCSSSAAGKWVVHVEVYSCQHQHRSTATRPLITTIASARLQATTTTKQPPVNRDVLLPHRSHSLENGCELARIGQGLALRCQCQNAAVSEASCSEPSLVRQPWRRADQGDKLRLSKCGCPARARGPKKTRAAKRLDAARARYVRRLSVRPRLHRNP